ncbi:NAD-binding protein [Pseudochelatococcus sp. B33]
MKPAASGRPLARPVTPSSSWCPIHRTSSRCIGLHQKDIALALQTARQLEMSLPNTATVQELFDACAARGGHRWDYSGLIDALEPLAGL